MHIGIKLLSGRTGGSAAVRYGAKRPSASKVHHPRSSFGTQSQTIVVIEALVTGLSITGVRIHTRLRLKQFGAAERMLDDGTPLKT